MKPLTQTAEPISEGQNKLITRMIIDVADSDVVKEALARLSKKQAERLKGNPQFVENIRTYVVSKIVELSVVNEFANEEVPSTYGYLSGYENPMDVNDQCNKLRELFSGLGFCNQDLLTRIEKGEAKLPNGAEGWFAIPNWKKNPEIFGKTYSAAVQTILNALDKARKGKFCNYRDGEIDEKHLRQSAVSKAVWEKIAKEQGDADILIVPAQFGIRHRGRSVRRARVVMEDGGNEVGLGAFSAGAMLLTHPNRLNHYDDLWIDLSGDEWSPGGDGGFSNSLVFSFDDDELEFGDGCLDGAHGSYGSGSVFLSQ
jgi:hypothetical protein